MTAASQGDLRAIVAGLRKSPLLASLSDRQLQRLARSAKVRDLPADTVIVAQGKQGVGFYVVLEGRVNVRKDGRVVASLGRGDFFGELALFEEYRRSADVVTTEPTTVVILTRWEFWGFASDQPAVLRTILEQMARRFRETSPAPSE